MEREGTGVDELKKRHVLFIADIANTGGAAEALAELCQCLIETGEYRCTVLTPQESQLNKRLEEVGARTVVTHHGEFLVARPRAGWKVPVKWAIYLLQYVRGLLVSVREAENAVDFDGVDIIHTNVPRNDLGLLLARRHAIPHVIHLRECSFSHFKCWSYRHDPVEYLAHGADAFVGISRYITNYWVSLGLPKERVHTVYDGVQMPDGRNMARVGSNGKIRLLFLGGYVEAKGTGEAIEAVALVEKMRPGRVELGVYGGGSGEYRAELDRLIRAEGLSDIVRLHDEVENVWSIIPLYDVGLACSHDEGFGRTVIEFQACGVPPIVSDSGAFPELVQSGVNGLVYEKTGGPSALARRICELVDDPDLRNSLARKTTDVAARFSAEKNAEGIVALYDGLLGNEHFGAEAE